MAGADALPTATGRERAPTRTTPAAARTTPAAARPKHQRRRLAGARPAPRAEQSPAAAASPKQPPSRPRVPSGRRKAGPRPGEPIGKTPRARRGRLPVAPRLPRTLRVRRQTAERPAAPGPTYYALTVPGLEELAADELRRAGADVRGVISRIDRRDGVVLFAAPDIRRVMRCGTLEDVCQVLIDVPTPPAITAPKQLAALLDREALEAALVAHNALRPKRHGRSYKVACRVAGKHPFRREDLALAFERAVHAALPRWLAVEGASAVELWVHVAGPRTIVGLRLSGDDLAQRTWKHAHLPASLKPSVARALVLLAEARPGDVMIDLMCGAGTILRERADAGPARLILGGDSDSDALAAARENVRRTAALARWDATRLPLRDACVDVVVTNPPYGRQHEAVPGIDRLYARSLREAARVLVLGGRAVVLTGEADVLSRALPPTLRVRTKRRILLRGLAVTAFVLLRV